MVGFLYPAILCGTEAPERQRLKSAGAGLWFRPARSMSGGRIVRELAMVEPVSGAIRSVPRPATGREERVNRRPGTRTVTLIGIVRADKLSFRRQSGPSLRLDDGFLLS